MSAPRKKAAKKAPPSSTSKSKSKSKSKTIAEWEARCQPFFEACRRHFDFLVREHGFGEAKLAVTPPECVVRYTKPGGGVDILSDRLGPPWVVVTGGDPPARVGLHEIVALLDPGHAGRVPEAPDFPSPAQMDALLEHHAAFLRAHAGEALGSDPSLFARVLARR